MKYWKGFPSDVPHTGTVFQSHWNTLCNSWFLNMSMTCTDNLSNSGMSLWGLKDALVQLERLMMFLVHSVNNSPENLIWG